MNFQVHNAFLKAFFKCFSSIFKNVFKGFFSDFLRHQNPRLDRKQNNQVTSIFI